jgi:two-component system OmpR family sensor kinase/two-component system sensor histidine kinase BaeS
VGALLGLLFIFACGGFFLLFSLAAGVAGLLGQLGLPSESARYALAAAAVSLLVILVVLGVILRALRRMASPVGDLMEAAGRVADGDYSARVEERGPGEVRALARAFNSMAERLQAHDQQRRDLLADVTHELRTPLTVMQGNLEGLLDGVYPLDEDHLQSILEETHVMSRLIDDLRTLALAESGALKLQRDPVDMGALIDEAAASFQARADKVGVQLTVDSSPDLPALDLDAARIRQVLSNLIANALRYTPSGGKILVRCSIEGGGTGNVLVSVNDTGAGIPPDDLPHIFDRFYKSSDSRGTGLGLTIARNLVLAHGGEINAASEAGKGTTIRFTLPLATG